MIEVVGRLAGKLPELAAELAMVAGRLRESVVLVQAGGIGSGVVWESNGLIVTNNHVVAHDEAEVVFADGRTLPGMVIARDPAEDLAALRVTAVGLRAVAARDAKTLRVGEVVLAIGNPLGLRGAVTAGIVSGTGRRVALGRRWSREVVQADVELLPGNSGGALADAAGRVVGINEMVAMPGMALAVPSETVARFLARNVGPPAYSGIEGEAVPYRGRWRVASERHLA